MATAAPATTGGQDNDIIWRALIDDQTTKFFEQFDQRMAKLEGKTQEGFDKVDQTVKRSGVSMGLLAGVVSGLTTKLIDMGINAVQSFVQFIEASKDVRARVDTLGVSLNIVGQNAGYSKDEINKFTEAVVNKGITTRNARESLMQMAQAELDLTKAADMARVSQDAAVGAGINSSEAFQRITYAIITLQPEILRNMNITVDLQSEYSKFAVQAGKTAEQLTYAEKKQIAMNAVLRQGQVIAGTYEAAMGSVGKMLTSIPRYIEQLQYEIGGLFQPAYLASVTAYKEGLSELLKFVQSHREDIERFAQSFGDIMTVLMQLISTIKDGAGELGASFEDFFKIFSGGNENDITRFLERLSNLADIAETGKQALILLNASVAAFIEGASAGVEAIGILGLAAKALFSKSAEDRQVMREAFEEFKAKGDPVVRMEEAFKGAVWQSTQAINEHKDAMNKAAEATGKYAEIQKNKLEDALASTSANLKKIQKDLELEAAERALDKQRKAQEAQLQAGWEAEDRAREQHERLKEIMENYEEQKTEALKNASEARLEVEKDYQERLKEIKKQFDLDAAEYVRRRDAVGLMALIRQNKRQLDTEKENVEKRRKGTEDAYQKTLKSMDEGLQKQLKNEEKARQKQLEDYQRNLDRQKQLQALHDQWEEEDRQRKLQKQLEDIVKQFMSMDGVTQEGLQRLLDEWGGYFTQLQDIASKSYANLKSMNQAAMDHAPYEGVTDDNYGTKDSNTEFNQHFGGNGVIGQAGQVSSLLTPMGPYGAMPATSPVPIAHPSAARSLSSSHDMTVKIADAGGLDPYVQRIFVNGLLEIERNSGSKRRI